MIKYLLTLVSLLFCVLFLKSQQNSISQMQWGADFKIHITFSNDSTSIYDVKGLYHSESNGYNADTSVTYYPVQLDNDFVNDLKNRKISSFIDTLKGADDIKQKPQTLWSAIHGDIGGGFVHFINCLVYTFESGNLLLTAPLMKRPSSKWKPSPVTESYKRTKKWAYAAPVNQKLAQKEYKIKHKKGQLGDIMLLPPSFIQLFLNTNQKQYELMVAQNEYHKLAIINMVKLMVGANYLSREQIDYVQSAVSKSILKYNTNNLPSVIIFDHFGAAVAMSLTADGYKIEKIVFNNETELTDEAIEERIARMEGIIKQINLTNKKVFEKNLKSYYN